MKKPLMILAIMSIALMVSGRAKSEPSSGVEDLSRPVGNEPPMLGIHWARGFNPSYLLKQAHRGAASSTPDMSSHGGPVLPNAVTASIFWGSGWKNPGDKINGMDAWYTGFSGSSYAATSDEYTGSNGQVTAATTYLGHSIDYSKAASGNRTSSILAEVCKWYPHPNANDYYAVYVDLKRSGSYCAYHSWGSCNGTPIEFAFFWNLDGDAGCDPQSNVKTESQGLAALANVSGHELSETRTDPTGQGWYDSNGQENGDKCVWTFNDQPVSFPLSTSSIYYNANFLSWKLQGEWSNAAYDNNYGYPNSSGQNGCLDGDGDDGVGGNP